MNLASEAIAGSDAFHSGIITVDGFRDISKIKVLPEGENTATTTWQPGQDLHLQSSKVVPGDANARRLRSSSLSLVTWRSWNKMVSRLSPDGLLSLMAGGGEDASPFTGEPWTHYQMLGHVSLTTSVIIQMLHNPRLHRGCRWWFFFLCFSFFALFSLS